MSVKDGFRHVQILKRYARTAEYGDLALVQTTRCITRKHFADCGRDNIGARMLELSDAHRLLRQIAEQARLRE